MRNIDDILTTAERTQYPYLQHWKLKPGQMVLAGIVERTRVEAVKLPDETLQQLTRRLLTERGKVEQSTQTTDN